MTSPRPPPKEPIAAPQGRVLRRWRLVTQRDRLRCSRGRPVCHRCRNARMVEVGEDLRLTLKPRKPIGISGKRLGEDLQRHLPVQLGIGGLIDLAHPALANEGGDIVVAESGADVQGHSLMGFVEAHSTPRPSWLHPLHRMASETRMLALCGVHHRRKWSGSSWLLAPRGCIRGAIRGRQIGNPRCRGGTMKFHVTGTSRLLKNTRIGLFSWPSCVSRPPDNGAHGDTLSRRGGQRHPRPAIRDTSPPDSATGPSYRRWRRR